MPYKGGYNFSGLILGEQGSNLKQLQADSGARIEVQDSLGNLSGRCVAALAARGQHATAGSSACDLGGRGS